MPTIPLLGIPEALLIAPPNEAPDERRQWEAYIEVLRANHERCVREEEAKEEAERKKKKDEEDREMRKKIVVEKFR